MAQNIRELVEQNNILMNNRIATGDLWFSFEAQAWVTRDSYNAIEGDCIDHSFFTSDYDWYEPALRQIDEKLEKIHFAIVTDDDFADLLAELGYVTLPCIDWEDGEEYTYIAVFANNEDCDNWCYDN